MLFVPSFNYNLFSISTLTKDSSCSVFFFPDKCIFQDQNQKRVLAVGNEHEGLYHLQLSSSPCGSSFSSSHVNSVSKSKTSALWHLRLGHPSLSILNKIDVLASNIDSSYNKSCPICPIAKQCSLPFNNNSSYASCTFDLIHIDLWGPYNTSTQYGCKYFLTVVDDHSSATCSLYQQRNMCFMSF